MMIYLDLLANLLKQGHHRDPCMYPMPLAKFYQRLTPKLEIIRWQNTIFQFFIQTKNYDILSKFQLKTDNFQLYLAFVHILFVHFH